MRVAEDWKMAQKGCRTFTLACLQIQTGRGPIQPKAALELCDEQGAWAK